MWKDWGSFVGEVKLGLEVMGFRNKDLGLIWICEESVSIWGFLVWFFS